MPLLHFQGIQCLNVLLLCSKLLIPSALAILQWNGNWAFSCDFNGNHLSQARMRGEDCGGYCYSDPSCTHFTWTSLDGGTCFLKSGSVTKADAVNTGDPSMVCGVIRETKPVDPDPVKIESNLTFSDEPMTKEQCAAQFTPHCRNGIRTVDDCAEFKGLEIYCSGPVILPEISGIVTALSKPPVRAVYLGIADGPLVTYQNFAPVRTQIVRFIFDKCLSPRSTAKLAELRLPNLRHFELQNCYDLDIRKDDYKYSSKIRVVVFYASTIRTLERGTLSDLPELQLVSMEFWMNKHEMFPQKLREFSSELHCGCEFGWFRGWLKNNSRLLQSGEFRKLYHIPDSWFNYHYPREDMNLPIDCGKPFPSGKAAVNFSLVEFSINENEDQCR